MDQKQRQREFSTYCISAKREQRASMPSDWTEQIAQTSGLQVLSSRGGLLLVRASNDAMDRVRSRWGELCHIEREILHATQSTSVL